MTADQMRQEAARLMVSRAGKNSYTQGSNRVYFFGKPEGTSPGYSDCSSSVRACIKRAAGINIGSNTDAQIRNRAKGVLVHKNDGNDKYPPLNLLKPGDCVYFRGNVAHVWNVGHVEMVTSANGATLYGHGSGKGPKKHKTKAYGPSRGSGKGYLCVIRWIKDDGETVPGDPTTDPPTSDPTHGILITGNTVNLRTGPGTDYATVDTAKAGRVFERIDTQWYPILVDGRVLWVSNKYAKEV